MFIRCLIHAIRILAPVLALPVAICFLPCCSSPPVEPIELKVGVFVYNVGNAQTCCGSATANVVTMIQKELDTAGGIMVGRQKAAVRIFSEGIESNREKAVMAAEHFINQKGVHVIIGPQHSGDAIPVAKIAEESRVLMISPMSTNPRTTYRKKNVFRTGFLDDFQGDILANFAFTELKVHRAAILYNKAKPYNRGIADRFSTRFTELGGTITSSQTYVTGQKEYSRQLYAIKAANPELLLLPNHNNDVLIQGPQVREYGIDAILLGTDAWNEHQLASIPAFDGAYKTAHWSETIDSEANRVFVKQYKAFFSEPPNSTAALTYDAFHILFAAVEAAGSVEPSELSMALYELPPFPGLSGLIDYTETGDPVKGAVVLKINQGQSTFKKMYRP